MSVFVTDLTDREPSEKELHLVEYKSIEIEEAFNNGQS